jgi:glycosyltransferase involved in cell wall biosynthesis
MKRPDLSICMIVKNEEKYLADCLQSLAGLEAEIIIVDTGSTDATKEIALQHSAQLHETVWNQNFSEARNYALSKATGRWILYIDADERLTPESVPLLNQLCKSDDHLGIYCTLQSVDKAGGRPNIMKYIRLFHAHPEIHFAGRVHEQIYGSLVDQGYQFVDSDIKLLHVGYDISPEGLAQKAGRNLNLLLKDFEEKHEGYTAFQIASSYAIMQQKENAISFFNQCLMDTGLAPHYRAHANRFLAASALEKGKLAEAQQFIHAALQANALAPLVNIIAGKIAFQSADLQTGFDFFKKGYENNKALIEGRMVSPFDIMIDINELLLQGISFAVQYRDKTQFLYYMHEFSIYNPDAAAEVQLEIKILHTLFENGELTPDELASFAKMFSPAKSDTYCNLIKNHTNKNHAIAILHYVLQVYADEHIYFALGVLCDEVNRHVEALQNYVQALKLQPTNLPVILHAIALLLRLNQIPDALALLNASEPLFKHDEMQMKVIATVRHKINLLTQAIVMQN